MEQSPKEHWKNDPEEHDFPAADSFLSLLLDPDTAKSTVSSLRHATGTTRKAKDLLRASGLPLLPADNPHVASDLAKVKRGERLSPVLLVRGRLLHGLPLTIADGYHRVCASHLLDENADIPCRIVDLT
ncbi:MAG TPA: hypothetical protein VEH29_06465 [Acidimicrobiales bacterium]|nr:hypothetical protein [Acidimicrobiales bacterium]